MRVKTRAAIMKPGSFVIVPHSEFQPREYQRCEQFYPKLFSIKEILFITTIYFIFQTRTGIPFPLG